MRGFGIPASARAPMIVALAIAGLASTSQAATKHQNPPPGKLPFLYNTTGMVNVQAAPGSVTGPALLQYEGVTGATFMPGSGIPIQLGQLLFHELRGRQRRRNGRRGRSPAQHLVKSVSE